MDRTRLQVEYEDGDRMNRKTWAVVLVSVGLVLLALVGVVLLGLALSGRMGPGMMSGRGFPGARGLLGGRVGGVGPRSLVGLLMLPLLCLAPLGLVAAVAVVVWWALRQHQAPPSPPSA